MWFWLHFFICLCGDLQFFSLMLSCTMASHTVGMAEAYKIVNTERAVIKMKKYQLYVIQIFHKLIFPYSVILI